MEYTHMSELKSTLRREFGRGLRTVTGLVVAALRLHGQSPVGEIRLQIKDPSGAAMEAFGKLESLDKAVQRNFQTDALGRFTLGNLPYGRYRLEVSKAGFTTKSVLIGVQSTAPVSRTITMSLGSQVSKVDVV